MTPQNLNGITKVQVLSGYKVKGQYVMLPDYMAWIANDLVQSFENLKQDLYKHYGATLILTDLGRTYEMQLSAYLKKGKDLVCDPKKGSWHMAGRAFDVVLKEVLKHLTYDQFREVCAGHGWYTIISVNDKNDNEAWHFQHPKPYKLSEIKKAITAIGNYQG